MQYYLWWTSQGLPPADALDLPKDAVLVRSVRHHDDHEPLTSGDIDQYHEFNQEDIRSDDLVEQPWTDEQMAFIQAHEPVRIVTGRPGTGKTTVLWEAITAGLGSRVLYLTWSESLCRRASEEFTAFAPEGVTVVVRSLFHYMSDILRRDIHMQPLETSRKRFAQCLAGIPARTLGIWANRMDALHDEVRGFLVGRAVPGRTGVVSMGRLARLSEAAYRSARSQGGGLGEYSGNRWDLGSRGARESASVLGALDLAAACEAAFPDLIAAGAAISRIAKQKLADELVCWDAIVIDECQDLTLLELAVPITAALEAARRTGKAPIVLIAGDDGQTVRPTGFDWGPYKDFLTERLTAPKAFHLGLNLRSPEGIARVINQVQDLHLQIDKSARPRLQAQHEGGQHVASQLMYSSVNTRGSLDTLAQLAEHDVALIYPMNGLPSWLGKARTLVLTPADAKGLDYQSVCVINGGKQLAALKAPVQTGPASAIDQSFRRTALDQFRVTVSRATETLVFLDIDPTAEETVNCLGFMGSGAPFEPSDLLRHLADGDTTADERVLRRITEARQLLESRGEVAWNRAMQAVALLGEEGTPNSVMSAEIRRDALRNLAATAAWMCVVGLPEATKLETMKQAVGSAIQDLGLDVKQTLSAFIPLMDWFAGERGSVLEVVERASTAGEAVEMLRPAFEAGAQLLLSELAEAAADDSLAERFAGDVEAWVSLTGTLAAVAQTAAELRGTAVDALLDAGRPDAARTVWQKIQPPDRLREARILEAKGDYAGAAAIYASHGSPEDTLRCLRKSGDTEGALAVAGGQEAADLQWLNRLLSLVTDRPSGVEGRLYAAEADRAGQALAEVARLLKERSIKR